MSGEGGDIPSITILSLMRDCRIDYIDLLKLDIEGSEREVFEVCDWQERVDSVVVELHDRFVPGCSEAVDQALPGFCKTTCGDLSWYRRSNVGVGDVDAAPCAEAQTCANART